MLHEHLIELVLLFSWIRYPEVKLLDLMAVLILWGNSILFSIVVAQFTFPSTVYKFPFSSYPADLLFLVLLVIAILSCVRWYLTVALIFISLMVSDAEHLFMCLLAISMSLGKCLFRSSAQLLIQLFGGFFF